MLAMMAVVGKLVGHQHSKQIYLKSLYIRNLYLIIPARLGMLAMLAKGLNSIFIDIKKTPISPHCQQFKNCNIYTWLTVIYTILFLTTFLPTHTYMRQQRRDHVYFLRKR